MRPVGWEGEGESGILNVPPGKLNFINGERIVLFMTLFVFSLAAF